MIVFGLYTRLTFSIIQYHFFFPSFFIYFLLFPHFPLLSSSSCLPLYLFLYNATLLPSFINFPVFSHFHLLTSPSPLSPVSLFIYLSVIQHFSFLHSLIFLPFLTSLFFPLLLPFLLFPSSFISL